MSAAETGKNNLNGNPPQKPDWRKRIAGAFVIVICVSGALFSLHLFRLDLLQSIASKNRKPVGAITVSYNNVQRCLSNRVLWSRLAVDAPVYLGDLIRTAENSSATLNINNDVIDINENTMIRIRLSPDGSGRVIIDLGSGSLSRPDGGAAANAIVSVTAPKAVAAPKAVTTPSAAQTVKPPPAKQPEPKPVPAVTPEPAPPEPKPIPAVTPEPAPPEPIPAVTPEPVESVASVVSSSPQTPVLPEEKTPPPDVPKTFNEFISLNAGWKTLSDSASASTINIAREIIDGIERDVLTIYSNLAPGGSRWAGATLTEENYFSRVLVPQGKSKWSGTVKTDIKLIQKLVNANGVRLKILGDGKRWRVYFATTEVTDTAYFGVTIPTKKGEIISVDIPLNSKLNQPSWSQLPVGFIKRNVKGITIEKNGTATNSPGESSVKVFDFEIY